MNIRVFTKPIVSGQYDAGLANSVHFEVTVDGQTKELNNGYGILFPKAQVREDGTIAPRGAMNPAIVNAGSRYLIVCDYVNNDCRSMLLRNEYVENESDDIKASGLSDTPENVAPSMVYAWETSDFTEFRDLGLIEESSVANGTAEVKAAGEITVPDAMSQAILTRWLPPYGIENTAQREFRYPLSKGFADPVVFTWNGKWYFLATNDLNGNIGLFMREAESIEALFDEGNEPGVILDFNEENGFVQTFWAPEWHVIGGVPYILFAVGGKQWAPQSHMMKYKGTGDIMKPENWEKPVRVKRQDGSFLCEDGITLDMTYLRAAGRSYIIWSERYHIGTPLDSGSMIYIGEIDEKNPTVLISDKVLLTRPLLGWENVAGTINNEGPYCLVRGDKVMVSYSGGDACGHYYAVGLLTARVGDNLLDIGSWKKAGVPFFSAYSVKGIDGPGHSSFFKDENGVDMIAFHGQDHGRQSGIRQVLFTADGMPVVM